MVDFHPAPCDSCRAPIVQVVNARTGGRQPFDAVPAPDGTFGLRMAWPDGLVAVPLTVAQRFGRPHLYRPHPSPCRRRPPAALTNRQEASR